MSDRPRRKPADTWTPGCFTAREVAKTCDIPEHRVWEALRSGELPSVRNRLEITMVTPEALDAFAAKHGVEPATPKASWEQGVVGFGTVVFGAVALWIFVVLYLAARGLA